MTPPPGPGRWTDPLVALGEGALHQALALSLRLPAQRGVPREVTAVAQLGRVAAALGVRGQRGQRSADTLQ